MFQENRLPAEYSHKMHALFVFGRKKTHTTIAE